MLEGLQKYGKLAMPILAVGVLIAIVVGIVNKNVPQAIMGYGTPINALLVLLGVIAAVVSLKNSKSNQLMLAAVAIMVTSLVFPYSNSPISSVSAVGVAVGSGQIVPFIGVRLCLSLLAVLFAPVAGILGLKAVYTATK